MDKTPHLSKNVPPDRRALPDRRAQRTRQTLSQALIALIQEKRYEAITVQNICDRANVGRSTFYAHFRDKDDLLAGNFQHMLESLGGQVELRAGQFVLSVAPLFQHVQEHHHLYKALAWGGGFDVLLRAGQQQWHSHIEAQLATRLPPDRSPAIPLDVLTTYLAGVLQTLLLWWLDRKMPYPPDRMDEMFQQLVLPGVNEALK